MSNNAIKNKVALVTGGASGIGRAIAEKLADNNFQVVVADINPPVSRQNQLHRHCDVSDGPQVDDLFSWMQNNTGLPQVLILNAGKGIHELLAQGDPEKWQEIFNINVMGALRCIRSFVPPMLASGVGHVVFISSVAAGKAYTYGGVYGASKAALDQIAETLRLEVLPHVQVTVVAAGITDSEFHKDHRSGTTNAELRGSGHLSAEDLADDVFYAISKRSGAAIHKIITRPSGQEF